MSYERELKVALQAVREAAGLCQAVQAQITPGVLEKKDRSPVTVADYGSQALVCRAINEAFPKDPIIGEEDAAALRESENRHLLDQVVDHVRSSRAGATEEEVCRWIDHGGARRIYGPFLDPRSY